MAISAGGTDINGIAFNGSQANRATLNGTVVWQRVTGPRAFVVGDTGASFSVSQTTVSWTAPTTGTLVGTPTYSNGELLGRVATAQVRTQAFQVTVPNDSTTWTNAGETISLQLQDTQEASTVYTATYSLTTNFGGTYPDEFTLGTNPTAQQGFEGSTYSFSADRTVTANEGFAFVHGIITYTGDSLNGTFGTSNVTVSRTVSGTIQEAALQPADILVSISVNSDGDVTVTTNNRGWVYYIGSAATGGTTFTSASNSVTASDVYPLVNSNTGRTPFIGIRVDDDTVSNDGANLSIRTLQSVVQPPALPNVSLSSVQAGMSSAGLMGAINSAGAPATSAGFYWSFTDTTAANLIANGTFVESSTTVGPKSATVGYPTATTNRTLYAVFVASNDAGSVESSVLSDTAEAITIGPNLVTTDGSSSVSFSSAVLEGTVTRGENATLGDTGFIYGPSEADVNASKISAGTLTGDTLRFIRTPEDYGSYTATIVGLSEDTEYFFAATTLNPTGYRYGDTLSLTTLVQEREFTLDDLIVSGSVNQPGTLVFTLGTANNPEDPNNTIFWTVSNSSVTSFPANTSTDGSTITRNWTVTISGTVPGGWTNSGSMLTFHNVPVTAEQPGFSEGVQYRVTNSGTTTFGLSYSGPTNIFEVVSVPAGGSATVCAEDGATFTPFNIFWSSPGGLTQEQYQAMFISTTRLGTSCFA